MVSAQPITRRTKFTAVVNGRRARTAKPASRKTGAPRRKNPIGASTVLLGYLNPPEKTHMQKKQKKSKIRRAIKKNPTTVQAFGRKAAPHRRRPRRRNPLNTSTLIGRPLDLVKAGVVGVLAYFIARQLPQILLKQKNTGWVGYVSNLVTALGTAAAANKMLGPTLGQAAFVGGGMYLVSRVSNEQTPIGRTLALSGIGDPQARGMGTLVPGYWASPAVVSKAGQPVPGQFQPIVDAVRAQLPAPQPVAAAASAGVSGGRFAARF
jgi:hypothetical protein